MSGAVTAAAIGGGSAVLGGAMGLMGASKNSKAQSNAMNQQTAMQQAQLAFQQQQYNRYLQMYGPIEKQLTTQAGSANPLFYDQNAAAIKQNYGNAIRNEGQAMSMRGMAGGGQDVAGMRGAALGQAGALSGAYNTGMQNRLSLGTTLLGRSPLQSAGQNVAGSMQGMANLYGNQANLYGNAAQQGGQAVQGAIRGLGYGYGMNNPGQQNAPGGYIMGSTPSGFTDYGYGNAPATGTGNYADENYDANW